MPWQIAGHNFCLLKGVCVHCNNANLLVNELWYILSVRLHLHSMQFFDQKVSQQYNYIGKHQTEEG